MMNTKILVLGATGGIGYAVTQNLVSRGIPVAILVRNKLKALQLFEQSHLITIHEGDVQDVELLNRIATDKTIIFHGINYPYTDWFGNIDTATKKIIDAASISGATIVYPGSVYNFGNTHKPIHEHTVPKPCSKKGKLRVRLEEMLENAVIEEKCKVIVIRLPDFWGPNVVNHGTIPIFENALRKRPMYYIGNGITKHQLVYTPDAANIIVMSMLIEEKLNPFEVINYGGQTFDTAYAFLYQVAEIACSPKKVKLLTRPMIAIMALFKPMMREVKEMLYLFENPVLLDDHKARMLFPEFHPTPTHQAIEHTLAWFKKNHSIN